VDVLAAQAELLHLPHNEPMATQTQTQVREEPPYIRINLVTGHAINVDEDTAENICRALGSDHADPLTNSETPTSLAGNSRSLGTKTDNRSTHHHNLLSDVPTEVMAEAVEEAVEAVEVEEEAAEDYPRQQDQACSPHTDELLTQSF
jgi:hypothetical protein